MFVEGTRLRQTAIDGKCSFSSDMTYHLQMTYIELWVKVHRKIITQTDQNTPKPAAKLLAGPLRHGVLRTLMKRFLNKFLCDICKKDVLFCLNRIVTFWEVSIFPRQQFVLFSDVTGAFYSSLLCDGRRTHIPRLVFV